MIISASRRTDIPSFYSQWFYNRLEKGDIYVRNPMNHHQVSKVILSPDTVDCFVFWTKNPIPMMKHLHKLREYPYYFQFTLTSYGKDIESFLPSKRDVLIPAFIELSKRIGKEKVIWRYDPILINQKYHIQYHLEAFSEIAYKLKDYTEKVVVSFLDDYKNTVKSSNELKKQNLLSDEIFEIGKELSRIACENKLTIAACAEEINMQSIGISHNKCIDDDLIRRILGCNLTVNKDINQRKGCGCVESIDIGIYNTCKNGCIYCYANYSDSILKKNISLYSETSEILCSKLEESDKVTERKMKLLKDEQIHFIV